jgi:FkbM family methyltransferase
VRLEIPRWLHRRLWRLGVDVVGVAHWNHPVLRRMSMLADHRVDVVLDVGANTGQYGRELRDLGYSGRIVSFEPLASAFAALEEERARYPPWEAERLAVGEAPGEATLHVSRNSVSSSLLPMLPRHVAAEPDSAYVADERVRVERLETLLARHVPAGARPFLKVDAQGSELSVVRSAGASLSRVLGLQLEMSLVPLYEGAPLLAPLVSLLAEDGFTLVSIEPGQADYATGQLLQVDGIFFRMP